MRILALVILVLAVIMAGCTQPGAPSGGAPSGGQPSSAPPGDEPSAEWDLNACLSGCEYPDSNVETNCKMQCYIADASGTGDARKCEPILAYENSEAWYQNCLAGAGAGG